ncbi:hypothetical protein Tco_1124771 [Tanacetum coccineum]|uniref:Uncharacterized protein n=1 Tax=Tanacetum coccineum TaxID=301880 RepID=A0ABQ5J7Q4_9ASTR
MQAEEQEKLSIEEKSKLFVLLLEARKKHFAAIRAKEKRNKPPTKDQNRNTMSTFLKNIAGYKHNQLKNKSFDDIQKLFDRAMKRVNIFVDLDTKLVEGSEKKLEEDKESEELQRLIEVVPDKEEVAIDAIPLATKPPSIVDYKIYKKGKKNYYQIIRADGSSKIHNCTTTAEDKAQRRLELKARSTLLMEIPNEHQLKFNSIKYAKSLLQAVENSVRSNFDRLQKLISQLEIHGESISQEDIYEPEVKGISSSSTNTQNVAFVSANSSTNGAVNTAHGATTASTQATAVNPTTIDNLSDAVICAFFSSQPNSP